MVKFAILQSCNDDDDLPGDFFFSSPSALDYSLNFCCFYPSLCTFLLRALTAEKVARHRQPDYISLSPWVVCPASRVSLGGLTAMARSVLRYFFSPFVLLRLLFYFQPKDSNR